MSMSTHLVAEAVPLAQAGLTANSADQFTKIILGIIGSLFLLVLGGRMLAAYGEERWGKMLSLLGGGIVVAGVCYTPDAVVSVLRGLFSTFVGSA